MASAEPTHRNERDEWAPGYSDFESACSDAAILRTGWSILGSQMTAIGCPVWPFASVYRCVFVMLTGV
jgi:hypothetical protein